MAKHPTRFPINTLWQTKITNANKYYKQWEERFKCRKNEEFYEGFQWRNIVDIPYYRPYVVNLVFAELKKKFANILYNNIEYNCTPRPGNYGFDPDMAFRSAAAKQDFLNELISRANRENGFNESVRLCAMDSFTRFAVMEVAYAADWRNPAKSPIVTKSHFDDKISDDQDSVIADIDLPENERVYFKRVKASRFRVSVSDDPILSNCSWCGYYSYVSRKTLENTKGLKLPKDFSLMDASLSSEFIGAKIENNSNRAASDSKDILEKLKDGEVDKVWHIWDNEIKIRALILEPTFDVIWDNAKDGGFDYLPFATHRHDLRFDGWYPVPPVSQWTTPQEEINEARQQMRNYRRRFTRKFKAWGVAQEELEKFKTEVDGEIISMKNPNSFIEPIGNPEIGISIQDGLNAGRDDFNIVSGSSSDLSTAQADRTTATQSKITSQKAQIIESVEEVEFTKFYKQIGRLGLLAAGMNFNKGIWVRSQLGPGERENTSQDPMRDVVFRYITTQQLNDGFDIDIDISPINASPQKMQDELQKYMMFLAILEQHPMIALSPTLIRETAFRLQYRNEKVISQLQQVAIAKMQLQAMGAGFQQGNQGGAPNPLNGNNGAAGNAIRNATPATQGAIDTQLQGQV